MEKTWKATTQVHICRKGTKMKAALKEYKARYYRDNRDKLRAEQKIYTAEHKEHKKVYDKILK